MLRSLYVMLDYHIAATVLVENRIGASNDENRDFVAAIDPVCSLRRLRSGRISTTPEHALVPKGGRALPFPDLRRRDVRSADEARRPEAPL